MKLPGYLGYAFPARELPCVQTFIREVLKTTPELAHDDDMIVTGYFRSQCRTFYWYPKIEVIADAVHWQDHALHVLPGADEYRLIHSPSFMEHYLKRTISSMSV